MTAFLGARQCFGTDAKRFDVLQVLRANGPVYNTEIRESEAENRGAYL